MIHLDKLQEIKERFAEVTQLMAQPEIATDPDRMRELGREHGELKEVVGSIKQYEALLREREGLEEMVEAAGGVVEGELFQRLSWTTGAPAVSPDGETVLLFDDPDGRVISAATAAVAVGDQLFFGSVTDRGLAVCELPAGTFTREPETAS